MNPNPPAAVGARSITCQKVAGAIFGAFRGVLQPERVMASSNDVVPAIVYSGELVRRQGAELVGYAFLAELGFLGGRARLGNSTPDHTVPIHTVIDYEA